MTDIAQLESRIARLEAIEEIKQLKARHIQLTDGGYPSGELTELWAEDGSWVGINTDVDERWPDNYGTGTFTGHEEIEKFWDLNGKIYDWVLHLMVAPTITVNDDLVTASGKWHWLMPCVRKIDGVSQAAWLGGFQEDTYVKVDGVWKFQTVHVTLKVMATHEHGWAADRYVNDAPVS
jgi:hypothetical protein